MTELQDIAEDIVKVALDAGADDAVAEAIESSARQIRFSNSQIDAFNSWSERHAILFVAVGKRVFSSDIRNLDGFPRLAREIVESAKRAPVSKGYGGVASGRFKYKRGRIDRKIVDMRDPAVVAREAIAGAESMGATNVGGTLFVRHEKVGLRSSRGPSGSDENASVDLSVRAFTEPECSGHAVSCTPRLSQLKAEETGRRAGELASQVKNPIQGSEGKYDIIMEPLFLGSLVQSTTGMLSALSVEINLSMFAKKIGKPVASSAITIADDPTIDSMTRRAFDHEGVSTRRNVLVKKGVLKTYLHNTSTARRFKTKTTGNAGPLTSSAYSVAAEPRAFHPIIEPGDWKVDEIVEDTKHGLYLNHTWYTRFQNYSTGEFSTIPRDAILLVEGGEIVGSVKNIRISDNLLSLWKSVDAVAKSSVETYWWEEAAPPSHLPVARARDMNVTRSS